MSPVMTLWANSTATSNPALNTGLSTLKTSLTLPQNLIVATPPPTAYGNVWTVKILPTTADDGIIEMTTTFSNSFLYEFSVTGDATLEDSMFAYAPSFLSVQAPGGSATFSPFQFTNDLQYTLKTGESKTITFKMKLQKVGTQEYMLQFIQNFVPAVIAAPSKTLSVSWSPKVTLPGYPISMAPDMNSGIFYPETGGLITLQAGPDFALIKDWYYKEYAYTPTNLAAPTPVVTPTPEPVVPSITPTVAPSPTSTPSPEVTTPPVAPAA
ncbi:hypothetical protein BGX30_009028 [Mortierella sp. GBA39]|nr:hypothetical protein BGX30_009028 [Mortierella sp. GBA39]